MKYLNPLKPATILKKYKRFLIDFQFEGDPNVYTASTNSTGPMLSCWEPGWPIMLSEHDSPKRKYPHALELTHNGKSWIGVNTLLPNRLMEEALEHQRIPELINYDTVQREVKYGNEGKSKIDLLLSKGDEQCFVEIKCTNYVPDASTGIVQFPDARSTRAEKHLDELIQVRAQGHRAVLCFVVTREDCTGFQICQEKAPDYAKAISKAVTHQDVEILVYQCKVSPQEIVIHNSLPFLL